MPRTKYRPEVDGYAFTNTWTWEPTDVATITGIVTAALGAVEIALSPLIALAEGPVFAAELGIPFIGPWLVYKTIEAENNAIIKGIMDAITADGTGTYGLCGGMAFSSLDYWHKSWVLPRGDNKNDQPKDSTPLGTVLREYIWSRLLKSVEDNIWTFLGWMAIYHFEGDGGTTLRDKTNEQLTTLRNIINSGTPVTVGLIGTTWNPMNNHQILIYGFEDNPDGTTTLFAYDNTQPGVETTIRLNFSGSSLEAIESAPSPARGPLRGLFCTTYTPSTPPLADVLSQGVKISPAVTGTGNPVQVSATATNVGFHDSPAFKLVIAGDSGASVTDASAASILAGASRSLAGSLSFPEIGNHRIATVVQFPPFAGMTLTRFLPPQSAADNPDGSVVIVGPRVISAVTDAVCEVVNVAGGTASFSVDVADMGTGLTFQWTASGATIVQGATTQQVQVKMPAQAGVNFTLGVTVRRPDGGVSSGSETLPTLTSFGAGLAYMLCEIRQVLTQPSLMGNPGDPDPNGIIVDPEEIAALAAAAQDLTLAANTAAAAARAGSQVIIPAAPISTVASITAAGAPAALAPSAAAPAVLATSALAPSGLAPSGLAPSGLAPSGLAPSGLAPSGLAPSAAAVALAPSALAPSAAAAARATATAD
jgi:hypothetical protein